MAEIKKRYSDEDLAEFKQIIDEKLERARKDYSDMMKQLRNDEMMWLTHRLHTRCWRRVLQHRTVPRYLCWQSVSRSLSRDWSRLSSVFRIRPTA